MTIGTTLFHQNNAQIFAKLDTRISGLQSQISSGQNDPRPSADLVRATRLSAAQDQFNLLDRYNANLTRAQARLDLADSALGSVGDVLQRFGELALRASNDTMGADGRRALRAEGVELRDQLLGLANTADDTGRALFGGFRAQAQAFVDAGAGVVYHGDGGQPRLQVSETARVATGPSGAEVFLAIPDPQTGAGGSVFAMVDDFLAALEDPATTGADIDDSIARLRAASDHIADHRAGVGAMGAAVNGYQALNAERRLGLERAIAGLQDLDMAAAITDLQKMMMTREAAQQSYVKIAQRSLFDYLR